MGALFKKLTSHGSVSIPVRMRRDLGLQPKDPVEMEMKDGKVIISPYLLRCGYCGTMENVKKLNGKGICRECAVKVYESFLGENGGDING